MQRKITQKSANVQIFVGIFTEKCCKTYYCEIINTTKISMWTTQKIDFSVTKNSLAHLLICEVQNQPLNINRNYENQTNLRFVPNQEQGASELHFILQQAHLQPTESVFQNVPTFLMDKCYMHAI